MNKSELKIENRRLADRLADSRRVNHKLAQQNARLMIDLNNHRQTVAVLGRKLKEKPIPKPGWYKRLKRRMRKRRENQNG